ncbi:rRNA maturation RNase YbeY [Rikenella microfusus]|uniref:rRNA maturation RNase YbeY n=1 Tax=Rikenella microfusus TaxID=28139 RepID=UPI001D2175C9|nr:rRNA maturation RNase YbeY [Rikenella microfusus]HJE89356.1 rRNA maturation RNase YbeY [Rikenella microfusus]
MAITFNSEDTKFNIDGHKRETAAWMRAAIREEGFAAGEINVIFCSDPYLLEINRQYLRHDYFTDIITFDYCENGVLSGDLFISVDTVKGNAEEYGVMFHVELLRVIIHGVMHLAGYKDKTDPDAAKMRERENHYLAQAPEGLLEGVVYRR